MVILYTAHTDSSRHTLTVRLSTVLCVIMQHININDGKQTTVNLSGPKQTERKKRKPVQCTWNRNSSDRETEEQERLSHIFTLRLYHCQVANAGSLNTTLQKVCIALCTQDVTLAWEVT